VTAEIVERTDGIPLFVEEMTKAVDDKQRWTSFNLVHGPTKHFQTRRVDPMGVFDDH
jgi:hypothetical protein